MILVTRLNGSPFAVNPDLLERVEPTPDTVLTLIDGTKYIVTESVTEIITLVREFRASVVVAARAVPREGLDDEPEDASPAAVAPRAHPHLQVAPAPVAAADEVLDPSDTVEMDEIENLEHAESSADGAPRRHVPVLAAVPAPVDVVPSGETDPVTVGN